VSAARHGPEALACAWRIGALCCVLALSGCGTFSGRSGDSGKRPEAAKRGGYYLNDGPGDNPPANLDEIADAVPRVEPLGRGTLRPYSVMGRSFTPMTQLGGYRERGMATWYGRRYHGQPTASGEIYDMYAMTAAHPVLPIPSYVRVTNLANARSVVVRINDRGPFLGDRLIDLSYVAAHKLDILRNGSALVEVESIVPTSQTAKRPAPVVVPSTQAAEPAAQAQAVEAVAEVAPASVALAAPTLPVERTASAPAGAYYLQLGAFSLRDNAQRFADRMRIDLGALEATFVIVAADNLHRVQAGPYGSRDAALQAAAQIGQALGAAPLLVAPR
jgi:rare lipoprotein A